MVARDSVRSIWIDFTEEFEGGVSSMYSDIRGIPTIAYGNAVFTPGEASALPMVHPDGTLATTSEKIALWASLKGNSEAARRGWTYAAKMSPLRMTREGMSGMALAKFDANDNALAKRCAHWASMPACGLTAMHSLAWACGAGSHFPRLFSAINVHDYESAAVEIHMNEWTKDPNGNDIRNAGLVPRNVANKILMKNASRVDAYHLDPDYINWRTLLQSSTMPPADPSTEIPTQPKFEQNEASQPTIWPAGLEHTSDDDEC